ncbi:hypothetical protein JB92DRAFT_3122720 [Gautieria morchelliformis]|nr:hypothetical protein JB92DRAFT_3122720 [Gautieria morchelliformis]
MPDSNTSAVEDYQLGTTGQKCTHEPEPLTASGQSKQQKQDLFIIEARHVGCAMDAFLNPGMVFNFGLENMVALASTTLGDLEIEGITDEQIRWFRIYKRLCARIGHFEACIIDVEAHTFCEHEKLFKAGLSAARSEDIVSLKVVVVNWLSTPPCKASTAAYPLARNSKTTQGFNNPVIGDLLCPRDLKWSDSAVQQGLRDGTIDIQLLQWPNFIYEDCTVPSEGEDMWVGFLQHHLLVKTLKHIYTSPSSVDGVDGNRATRSSKAALVGMTGMSVGAIADAVVKLHHSLSSHSTFQKNDRTSNNQLFYYGLLEVLEVVESQEQVRELLQWYDRRLFPGQESTKEPAPNSALARMRTQMGITRNAAAVNVSAE